MLNIRKLVKISTLIFFFAIAVFSHICCVYMEKKKWPNRKADTFTLYIG
jgi:hypothetical protein